MANQANAAATQQAAASTQATPPQQSGRIVKALKFALATKAWSKQFAILRKRGSFPLLRSVIKSEMTNGKIFIPLEAIHPEYLAKSILGHRIIVCVAACTFFYSVMLGTRGVAIAIKLGDVANGTLLLSVPLLIITGLRAASSYRLQAQFAGELARRSKEPHRGISDNE